MGVHMPYGSSTLNITALSHTHTSHPKYQQSHTLSHAIKSLRGLSADKHKEMPPPLTNIPSMHLAKAWLSLGPMYLVHVVLLCS